MIAYIFIIRLYLCPAADYVSCCCHKTFSINRQRLWDQARWQHPAMGRWLRFARLVRVIFLSCLTCTPTGKFDRGLTHLLHSVSIHAGQSGARNSTWQYPDQSQSTIAVRQCYFVPYCLLYFAVMRRFSLFDYFQHIACTQQGDRIDKFPSSSAFVNNSRADVPTSCMQLRCSPAIKIALIWGLL